MTSNIESSIERVMARTISETREDLDAMLDLCQKMHKQMDGITSKTFVSHYLMQLYMSVQMALISEEALVCIAGCKPADDGRKHHMVPALRLIGSLNVLHNAFTSVLEVNPPDSRVWSCLRAGVDECITEMGDLLREEKDSLAKKVLFLTMTGAKGTKH